MGMINTGISLNQNTITAALYNMIISQRVFDSGVASTELADRFKVDGTLYGDKKLYYSFDIGAPEKWLNDGEAPNLLKLNRNKSGKIQEIVMGIYQIIAITTDQYLSKQAFMREGTFAEYTGFLKGSLRKIKKVYDNAIIRSTLGNLKPATDRCDVEILVPLGQSQEETNRLEAQSIAATLEILVGDLEDNNRDFNALGYLRSYSADDFIAIWNIKWAAQITKVDLPTIFHNDIKAEGKFQQYKIPQKWFGRPFTTEDEDGSSHAVVSSDSDFVSGYGFKTAYAVAGGFVPRIKYSGWYDVSDAKVIAISDKPYDSDGTNANHYVYLWAGDIVPSGSTSIKDDVRGLTISVVATDWDNEFVYCEDETIPFVIVHKEALPYMSGFEVGTEFWNARSLTNNNYLIFGHNELEFIEEYPRIRVKVKYEETSENNINLNIDTRSIIKEEEVDNRAIIKEEEEEEEER